MPQCRLCERYSLIDFCSGNVSSNVSMVCASSVFLKVVGALSDGKRAGQFDWGVFGLSLPSDFVL